MRLSAAVAVACLSMGLATAHDAKASIKKDTTIPAQGLGPALQQLAKDRGVQLVYRSEVVGDRQSSGATGELTFEEALTQLLQGTGLAFEYLEDKAVTIIANPSSRTGKGDSSIRHSSLSTYASSTEASSLWDRFRLAQVDQEQNPRSSAEGSSSPGTNQASERSVTLEEVIVTAQKREERLLETPISIGVLSGADLDRGSSRGINDVLNQVAGVSLTEGQPGQVDIVIRGVVPGAGATTTAFYQDDVPFSLVRWSFLPDSNAFDLSRVEVLRGPQGTLYGANALNGVVRILTNDADLNAFQTKARLRASSTEDGGDNYGGDLAVNVPLIPGKLAIRGVVSYSDLGGYIGSTFDGGQEINDTRAENYRFKLNYQPTENLSAKFSYTGSRIENGATATALDDFTTPFSSDRPTTLAMDVYGLVLEYDWSNFSILSSTGYIDYTMDSHAELFLGGTTLATLLDYNKLTSFSQEMRISSHLDGPWKWLMGAFYQDLTHTTRQDVRPVFPAVGGAHNPSETYAVFGDMTRSFRDGKFEVTGGLRYFNDRVSFDETGDFFARPLVPSKTATFDDVTGRFLMSYKPQEGLMLYASAARGFRSGLHQSNSVTRINPEFPPVDPDSLTTYEFGAKGHFGGIVTYETAVYYTDWKEIQQSLLLPIGFVARVNAGGANGPGVDASFSFQPTSRLIFEASIGWNDLKFDGDTFNGTTLLFAKGERPNNSPEWTGSVGGTYRMLTPRPGLSAVLSSNFAYGSPRENRFLTGTALNLTESDAMGVLKASVGLEAERWSANLFGDNLLNDDGALDPPSAGQAFVSIRQRPRTVGLQVTFDF